MESLPIHKRDSTQLNERFVDGSSIPRIALVVHRHVTTSCALRDTLRIFRCGRCGTLAAVCSRCDRGNIYCSPDCSQAARAESIRRAADRYQRSPLGRRNHARRQRDYRERKKSVTHQGSPPETNELQVPAGFVALVGESPETEPAESDSISPVPTTEPRCSFCGRSASVFYRRRFLQGKETPG